MYYAGIPTLVVRAKCPALISINGRVAGECGGEGYISVPLSANGDYYVTMQPLLPHDASGAALCPVTRRFSLENGIMEQTGYPDAVLCLCTGGMEIDYIHVKRRQSRHSLFYGIGDIVQLKI